MMLEYVVRNYFKIFLKSKLYLYIIWNLYYLCVNRFTDIENAEPKFRKPAEELSNQERNTLEVSFEDVEKYNQNLATTIIEEYYRIYPFLCQGLGNYVKDITGSKKYKECYVSFVDVATRHKVRELTTARIGSLLRISGQVIRTHPVHPELVLGTFVCLDCQTVVPNVEQQFKVNKCL